MLLIVYAIFFQSFVLFCSAFVDLPIQKWRDGSKSAFVQVPYINTMKNTKLLQLQKDISQLWPKGVVRYYLDEQSYDSFINSSIQAAMTLIESESCIEFHEESQKPNDNKTWIHFTNPRKERACVHEPQFMQNGEVVVTLGYDCLRQRDILHTLLHGIGFKDEVTHPHRDKYIKVLWNNIHPGYRNLFIKEPIDSVRSSVEYDPFSVMHFHERAYSINGKATILTLEPGLVIIPSEVLSQLDRMRLHMYFGNECNRRNINHLLDSCKMTLQNKDNGENEEDKDINKEKENQEKSDEQQNDDNNDLGTHKKVEFVFESNEKENNARDEGEKIANDEKIADDEKINKKQDPRLGQFVDPNENSNNEKRVLSKEKDATDEDTNENQNESNVDTDNQISPREKKIKMSGSTNMFSSEVDNTDNSY